MSLQQALYRGRQFWQALRARPGTQDLEQVRVILGPDLFALFAALQPSEQVHSLQVLQQLQSQGEEHPDLLVAALLHDVGKSRRKLRLWERAWIVLILAISRPQAHLWGSANASDLAHLPFWQQPLVVAEQHPAWGAEMVAAAGGSPLAVALIRHHADRPARRQQDFEGQLLARLQIVDDNN